jgi:hypothetical protein
MWDGCSSSATFYKTVRSKVTRTQNNKYSRDTLLRNAADHLQDYTASQPARPQCTVQVHYILNTALVFFSVSECGSLN